MHSVFPIPFGKALNQGFPPTTVKRLKSLQDQLEGVYCLCLDKRSLVSTVTFGWMEYLLRQGMHRGDCSHKLYGGLKILLLLFGDDGQLPPVQGARLLQGGKEASEAGQAGALLYMQRFRSVFS